MDRVNYEADHNAKSHLCTNQVESPLRHSREIRLVQVFIDAGFNNEKELSPNSEKTSRQASKRERIA